MDKPNNCHGCGKALPKSWQWCADCQAMCVDCGAMIGRERIRCKSCGNSRRWSDPEQRHRQSEAIKSKWADPEGRECYQKAMQQVRATPEYRYKMSQITRRRWADPEQRERYIETIRQGQQKTEVQAKKVRNAHKRWAKPGARCEHAAKIAELWSDPERRRRYIESQNDPEARRRLIASLREAHDRPETRQRYCLAQKRKWEDPKFRKKLTGENHYNWKGGCGAWYQEYPDDFTLELRGVIRKRDGFHCVLCGEAENGKAHSVHHIDYDKTNNDPANLITLCKSCHSKTNNGRAGWQMAFETLQLHRDNS